MRVAIIGDSFTHSYKDTWIEKVCNELELQVIHQVGFRGQAQYKIYLEFLKIIKNNPDVIICCHTEYTRFYNKDGSREWLLEDESFGKYIFSSILRDMQEICKKRNIKLVHIPCFEHEFIDKTYGLWFLCDGGLVNCSRADYNRVYGEDWTAFQDPRLNHFSPNGHQILANNIIPHIKTYITTDQEFHISLLYPEIFA
jgi:hypothetical protein